MADIELVIKIPDKVYGIIKYFEPALDSEYEEGDDVKTILVKGILKGVPLPKGHGRLIDADELKKHKYHDTDKFENVVAVAQIDWADTIIEADEESNEVNN